MGNNFSVTFSFVLKVNYFSVGSKNWTRNDTSSCMLMMDQNLGQQAFSKSKANIKVPGLKTNKCNHCDFASSWAVNLKKHLTTHVREKSNKCNQCDFASFQAGDLITHSGEKSHKCNQCDYAFCRASDLKKHMNMHSGEKSNKCNQCDFASFQAGHLRKHMKMHSGEKNQTNATNVTLHLLGQAI